MSCVLQCKMGQCIFYVSIFYFILFSINALKYEDKDFSPFVNHINSLQSVWRAEENELSNLDNFELKRLMGLKINHKAERFNSYYKKIHVANKIPDNFDARKVWRKCPSIRSVKDQSNCGSCWAVSTASAMSDRFCIASKSKVRVDLSAQGLMTCCSECTGGDPACEGGYIYDSWKYCKWHGLVTGGDYGSKKGCQPYSIKPCPKCSGETDTPACVKNKCTNKAYKKKYKKDLHKNRNYYGVYPNVSVIQSEILRNGPVVTGFIVYRDFINYKSGVYSHVSGVNLGYHAVRVIGWGTEKSSNQTIPYWLAVNSWTKSWGDQGLFKILRGRNECGFEHHVFAGIPRYR